MNIIAGKARGRKLKTLEGDATRPTQGKVRAALFSILMAWVPDASWVDLYAGSGAIGLEAASRGAKRVVLVENAAPAVQVVRDNMATLKLDGVELLAIDAMAALGRLAGQTFDVVFMDPPYVLDPVPVVEAIAAQRLVKENGRVVVEHRNDRVLPNEIAGLIKLKTSRYADACLTIYMWAPSGVSEI
jgi:16S rRNA (guanine(966)-N(2))-methyltransferase RsmD